MWMCTLLSLWFPIPPLASVPPFLHCCLSSILLSLSTGSKQYSAAIAFTLALFSHLINHVNIRLQAELEEGENPVPAFQNDGAGKGMGSSRKILKLFLLDQQTALDQPVICHCN